MSGKFKRIRGIPATLILLATLGGCTLADPPVALDRNARATLRKIVLVGPGEPPKYMAISGNIVVTMAVNSAVGGVPGNSATASRLEEAKAKGDFDAVMRIVNPDMGTSFRHMLAAELGKRGYTVTEQLLPPHADLKPSFDNVGSDYDAVLDVGLGALYESEPFSSKFTPTFIASAVLYDRKTGKVMYRDGYNYGRHSRTHLSPPDHAFDTYQSLMENPQRAADYFRAGVPVLIQALVSDLTGPQQ